MLSRAVDEAYNLVLCWKARRRGGGTVDAVDLFSLSSDERRGA